MVNDDRYLALRAASIAVNDLGASRFVVNGKIIKKEKVLETLYDICEEAVPISYTDCANAMLKMWMDNVVTDGEYGRIMDKLNNHYNKNVEDKE